MTLPNVESAFIRPRSQSARAAIRTSGGVSRTPTVVDTAARAVTPATMRSLAPGRPGAARAPRGITYGAARPTAATWRNCLRFILSSCLFASIGVHLWSLLLLLWFLGFRRGAGARSGTQCRPERNTRPADWETRLATQPRGTPPHSRSKPRRGSQTSIRKSPPDRDCPSRGCSCSSERHTRRCTTRSHCRADHGCPRRWAFFGPRDESASPSCLPSGVISKLARHHCRIGIRSRRPRGRRTPISLPWGAGSRWRKSHAPVSSS